jgi:hypothetical protein
MSGREFTQADVEAFQGTEPLVTLVSRIGVTHGWAPESEVHMPGYKKMHKAMHIFIWSPDKREIIVKFNQSGESENMWSSVRTHVYYAEDYYAAAVRELNTKLGLGLSMSAARNRMRFILHQEACIGTKMEHIRLYSFVLNSGEVIKSKEPLMTLPFDSVKYSLHKTDLPVAPVFRMLLSKFAREFTTGYKWREIL